MRPSQGGMPSCAGRAGAGSSVTWAAAMGPTLAMAARREASGVCSAMRSRKARSYALARWPSASNVSRRHDRLRDKRDEHAQLRGRGWMSWRGSVPTAVGSSRLWCTLGRGLGEDGEGAGVTTFQLAHVPGAFAWRNQPLAWQVSPDHALTITAGHATDWFIDP